MFKKAVYLGFDSCRRLYARVSLTFYCISEGEKVYAHQLVRTDSKIQKLDAFVKPTNQTATKETTNGKERATVSTNQKIDKKSDAIDIDGPETSKGFVTNLLPMNIF